MAHQWGNWKPLWLIGARLFTKELRGGDDSNYYGSVSTLLSVFLSWQIFMLSIFFQFCLLFTPPTPPPPPSNNVSSSLPLQFSGFSISFHLQDGWSAAESSAQHECFSSCDNYSIVQYLNRLLSHTHTSAVLLSKIRLNLNFPDITQHLSHSSTVMLSNYILKQCSKVVGCRQLWIIKNICVATLATDAYAVAASSVLMAWHLSQLFCWCILLLVHESLVCNSLFDQKWS